MSNMLASRADAKYGDIFTLTARSRGVVSDSNVFLVQKVDKFVGAAPITLHQMFAGSLIRSICILFSCMHDAHKLY